MSDKKYCRLCMKKETKSECGYGPKMWERYSVDDATDKEKNDAALESGIIDEATRIPSKIGNLMMVVVTWKGRTYVLKMFFPQAKLPSRTEVEAQMQGIYPGSKVKYTSVIEKEPGETFLYAEEVDLEEGSAWTKKSGKNPEGGLNEKGRKSYERENPGSDLKAPSKKVGNKRRASFCARMKGMKKKLTSSKTANDPDSRINKSLRAWNC